jgi:hypothetical protein
MTNKIKQGTATENVFRLIQLIAAAAVVICLILAASLCMQRFIKKAEAASMRYGYCLISDEGVWKKIAVFKRIIR